LRHPTSAIFLYLRAMHGARATIHKSQGSEYRAVVIPLTTQHYPMLQRNLIYTA